MALKKNRLAIVLFALFSLTVVAACSAQAADPTATPQPTATPTPVPVETIKIDPQTDPAGFLAALPAAEVDCAASAIGGVDVLTDFVSLDEDLVPDLTDVELRVMAACMSNDTMQKIVIGQLELEAGGLTASTSACVATHTDGIDFATLFSGQAVEQDTIISTMQALFCLNAEERRSLESSDQEIIGIADVGGIDALECAVDGAGPTGLQQFGAMFDSDGSVDASAVGEFMPVLIECGVLNDSTFAETGISAEQYSCIFSRVDTDTLDSILSISDDPNATPDLSSAAALIGAFAECGIDLQSLIDSSSDPGSVGDPTGSMNGGSEVTSELLVCLSDNGVSASLIADHAAGISVTGDSTFDAALAACENGSGSSSGGGIVIPDSTGGSTTIDPAVFEALPISAEQAQCLIDEVGAEQLAGIADGSVSPLAVLGALGACNISIADLIAG